MEELKIRIKGDTNFVSDIRFVSRFLYNFKVSASILYSYFHTGESPLPDIEIEEVLKDINDVLLEREQVYSLLGKYKKYKKLLNRINKYRFFDEEFPHFYVNRIEKGSLEIILLFLEFLSSEIIAAILILAIILFPEKYQKVFKKISIKPDGTIELEFK